MKWITATEGDMFRMAEKHWRSSKDKLPIYNGLAYTLYKKGEVIEVLDESEPPNKNLSVVETVTHKEDEREQGEDAEDKAILDDAKRDAFVREWFDKWCDRTKRSGGVLITTSIKELLKDFYNDVAQSSVEQGEGQEGWISVVDRLPEFDVKVLVFGTPKSSPQMGGVQPITTIAMRKDLWGTSAYRERARLVDANDFTNMKDVTHWMPLPATPNNITN